MSATATPPPPAPLEKRPLPRWLQTAGLLLGLVLLNAVLQQTYLRLDLTADQRFTLNPVTLETLDSIRQPVFVRVYLTGETFPPTVKQFQEAVRNTLNEYKARAGSLLQYEFVDPAADTAALRRFRQRGLAPVPVRINSTELTTQEALMFPFAEISSGERSEIVDLLKGTAAVDGLTVFTRAEQTLEYKLTATVRRLVLQQAHTVAFLQGHGEYGPAEMPEFMAEASRLYRIGMLTPQPGMALVPRALPQGVPPVRNATAVDVLVVAQPTRPLPERDKYLIDQYVMRGGRVLWLLDLEDYSQVDLEQQGSALAQPRQLRLEDLFFRYGVKLNANLLQDAYAGYIDAIQTQGDRDVVTQQRYVFFPRFIARGTHPILQNVDEVLLRYAGTIDSLPRPGLRYTPLLVSSPVSRVLNGSVLIDFNQTLEISRRPPPPREVLLEQPGAYVSAMLVEGRFASVFAGRTPPEEAAPTATAPQLAQTLAPTAQVFVADGAVILGNHSRVGGPGLPLDNETLLLNALDYLVGDRALAGIRGRDLRLRTLDPLKVRGNEWPIRVLNLLVPVLGLAVFGLVRARLRRRRNRG